MILVDVCDDNSRNIAISLFCVTNAGVTSQLCVYLQGRS